MPITARIIAIIIIKDFNRPVFSAAGTAKSSLGKIPDIGEKIGFSDPAYPATSNFFSWFSCGCKKVFGAIISPPLRSNPLISDSIVRMLISGAGGAGTSFFCSLKFPSINIFYNGRKLKQAQITLL